MFLTYAPPDFNLFRGDLSAATLSLHSSIPKAVRSRLSTPLVSQESAKRPDRSGNGNILITQAAAVMEAWSICFADEPHVDGFRTLPYHHTGRKFLGNLLTFAADHECLRETPHFPSPTPLTDDCVKHLFTSPHSTHDESRYPGGLLTCYSPYSECSKPQTTRTRKASRMGSPQLWRSSSRHISK